MANIQEASIQQSTTEIRKWAVDFTNDLPGGVTVSSGTATHIPPSGTAFTATVTNTTTSVVAQIGPLTVTGIHYLDVLATFSNGEKSEVRITFAVNYPSVTARSGMLEIISDVRNMTNSGVNDYHIAGVPYWSDAQIQKILDKHSSHFVHKEIECEEPARLSNNVLVYTEYPIGYDHVEQSTGGTAIFIVQNNSGGTVSAAGYTVDYTRGLVAFAADTLGIDYYVTGWAYDINAAAAEIYQMKANSVANNFDFSTDNHSVKKSQVYDHYIKQVQYYKSLSKNSGGYGMMTREDTC